MELQVSRQTISKWELGQSYPDFQRLVMLSDYFDMTLDELVKDIDLQDVRNRSLTDEKISSIFSDVEKFKNLLGMVLKIFCFLGLAFLVVLIIGLIAKLLFPESTILWRTY